MILKVMSIVTEYISVVLCLHRVVDKKIRISKSSFICFGIDMFLVYLSEFSRLFNILIYVFWFAFARIRVTNCLKDALKAFGIMIIVIPTTQMILYAIFVSIAQGFINNEVFLIIIQLSINIIMCIFLGIWKKSYLYYLGIKFNKINKFAIFLFIIGILVYVLLTFKNSNELIPSMFKQIVICMVIWVLTITLLENAEMEKKQKTDELLLYEKYIKAFEDALTTIKMRQHEFDNHINAILCMQYVIKDREELVKEQQKYCGAIFKENAFNKVLFLKVPPILSGYLFSKFTVAADKGILISHEIQEMEQIDIVSMNDLVETIGILFDNAVEALSSNGKHKLRVCVCYDSDNRLVVEIANESDRIPNDVIGKFFRQGYSTKGKDRGLGLSRLNDLKKKYKGELSVVNILIDNINYLQFRITYGKRAVSFHKRIGFGMHDE